MKDNLFITTVDSANTEQKARVLIASLRTFGGVLAKTPYLVFAIDSESQRSTLMRMEDVEVRKLKVPFAIQHYLFSEKVAAIAQAELECGGQYKAVTWIDPTCLILNHPIMYTLDETNRAAFRPVHIQNVGLRMDQPLNAYWRRIYKAVGIRDTEVTVESFVDGQLLRAYYNTHAFSFDPGLGLMGRWLEAFKELVTDATFQSKCCPDERHRIFLFQVILSALVTQAIPAEEIRILPPSYNYPYNLQDNIPLEKKASSLDRLVSLTYEGRILNPDQITDIAVPEPYQSFLREMIHQ